MPDAWIDVRTLKGQLRKFFGDNRAELVRFGSTVNQTFEAFVFAQVATWFKSRGWTVTVVNPADEKLKRRLRLKFSTRGRPDGYSHIRCVAADGVTAIQIRHQLRVATKYHVNDKGPAANVCLDVAVIKDSNLSWYGTRDYLPNADLITFGEAKHMSAFAELVAGFLGLVYELQPHRLKRTRTRAWKNAAQDHPAPFLFVSGHLWYTAEGVAATVVRRKLDVDIYSKTKLLAAGFHLP